MKFSAAIVAVGATVASAQSIASLVAQIPTCADACLVQYIPQVCSGGLTDYACQCKPANVATLTTDLTPCVLKACTTAEALQLSGLTANICSAYSASAGDATSAAASSAAPTSAAATSAAAAASSSVASSVSSAVASAVSSVSSVAMESSMAMTTSAAGLVTSSVAVVASSAVATTPVAVIPAATSAAMVTQFTGAAGPMATAGPIGAVLAAAIAFAL